MKKIDPAQTITIFANLGVIAGIVFLAVELRQNNELMRNQARYYLMDNAVGGLENRATDADLMDIRVKYLEGKPLSTAESLRLSAEASWVLVNWRWEFEQMEHGYIEKSGAGGRRRHLETYPYIIEEFEKQYGNEDTPFTRWMREEVIPPE